MALRDFLALLLLGALWGVSFIFLRITSPQFGPISLMGVRVTMAMVVLLPFLLRARDKGELIRHRWDFLFMGLFNLAIPFALISYATLHIEAGFTSLINSTTPIFAALVAVVWLRESISRVKVLGVLFGMAGIFVLFGDRLAFSGDGIGRSVLAAMGGACCYGISSNYHRARMSHLRPVEATAAALVWAALLMFPFALYFWPAHHPTLTAWGAVVALAVVSTSLALIIYLDILNRVGVLAATSVTFLIPIFAIFWGWAVLDEPLTGRLISGLPLVLAGTALTLGLVERLLKRGAPH